MVIDKNRLIAGNPKANNARVQEYGAGHQTPEEQGEVREKERLPLLE